MVTITIDNSFSKITEATFQQERAIRGLLSYELDKKASYFSGKTWNTKRCLASKTGEFPTGLLGRLQTFMRNSAIEHKLIDNRFKPCSKAQGFILHGKPYQWQVNAVKAAISSDRGIISAPTGTGKSLAMKLLILNLNVKTLIVVPSLEIKKQLSEVVNLPQVTIENIDSPRLKQLTDFDCLIIDEAHHVAAKTYHKLNKTAWKGIYHRFFFTATPFRNNADETLLFEAIAGELIYTLTYKEAISANYIAPVEAYYLETPKKATDTYTWAQVYSELVVNNEDRNLLLSNLMNQLKSANKATLCLVREVKHGKILAELTGVPFVSGEDDESRDFIRQFNSGEITAVIGTTAIIGEGIDTKPCEYVIIAGAGKAKSQFMQQVGRAVRRYQGKESAKVILIRDTSHKFLSRHFNAQRAILRTEYGVECLKLEI